MTKAVTSETLHVTSEGQRISYTYSEVDEETGAVLRDNIRESMVIMNIPANKEVLGHIEAIHAYVQEKLA